MDQTVKSHLALKPWGLYNFIRGFEWADKGEGGAYIWGHISGIKKMFHKDEMKRI